MVFGLDVSHPSPGPGASGRPSISAVVASMDRYASNYQATMRLQQGRTEMIDGFAGSHSRGKGLTCSWRRSLADMVVDLLERFKKLWKRLPERILIFRDGASEGTARFLAVRSRWLTSSGVGQFKEILECADVDVMEYVSTTDSDLTARKCPPSVSLSKPSAGTTNLRFRTS